MAPEIRRRQSGCDQPRKDRNEDEDEEEGEGESRWSGHALASALFLFRLPLSSLRAALRHDSHDLGLHGPRRHSFVWSFFPGQSVAPHPQRLHTPGVVASQRL